MERTIGPPPLLVRTGGDFSAHAATVALRRSRVGLMVRDAHDLRTLAAWTDHAPYSALPTLPLSHTHSGMDSGDAFDVKVSTAII